MSAFGTKRTCQSRSAMSAFGVTQTSRFQSAMSAFDPKRTSKPGVFGEPASQRLICSRLRPVRRRSCRGRLRMRINTRARGRLSIGSTVARNVSSLSILGIPKRSFDRPHAHAQIPSYRSPSVERFRIHIKGMVGSPDWLDGFPEVGRRRGPWRGG